MLLSVALLAASACQRAAPPPAAIPRIRLTIPDQNPSTVAVEIVDLPAADLGTLRKHPPSAAEWLALLRVAVHHMQEDG